jgi:hypothetical protein
MIPLLLCIRKVFDSNLNCGKVKGNVVPVLNYLSNTPWRRAGKRWYSSTILDVGTRCEWLASRPCRFTPVSSSWEAEWAPELVSTLWRTNFCHAGNKTRDVQPVTIPAELLWLLSQLWNPPQLSSQTSWVTFLTQRPDQYIKLNWSVNALP